MFSFRVRNIVPALATAGILWVHPTFSRAKDSPPTALELARSLNQAFIDVAEQVSPAVVVIKVAHRRPMFDLDDEENPFWEMIPPKFRKQFEEEREKQRKAEKRGADASRARLRWARLRGRRARRWLHYDQSPCCRRS
jgi:hypothetical protein